MQVQVRLERPLVASRLPHLRGPRLIVALAAILMLGACSSDGEGAKNLQQRADARATEARAHIDELAAMVGTDVAVLQDDVGACEPGDDDGLDLIYVLGVRVEPGAEERLRTEVADHFQERGWTVKQDRTDPARSEASVRFSQGTFTMGALISDRDGNGRVSGSGGCVR